MTYIRNNFGEVLLFVVLIVAVILLSGCVPTEETRLSHQPTMTTVDGLEYTVIYIEDMPCIFYSEVRYKGGFGGLTCNWDEWKQ